MSDHSNLIDVKIHMDFPSPLNEGDDETFPPNGNYLVSVRDFLLSQYLQMNLHQSCLLISILLYPRSVSPVALGCFLSCLLQAKGGVE